MSKKIIIGSRGSDLALWQANYCQSRLKEIGVSSEIKIITTKGDELQDLSFDKIEGKGFFTKEIEDALLKSEINVAVHSHKDLETEQPKGLQIAGVSYREDPCEALLIRPDAKDDKMPLGFKKYAVVGTSSARRKAQVRFMRPDIELKDIRGNVPTRINKLREGQFDVILLAMVGISRLDLDLSDLVVKKINPCIFIPAPAQGVLAYQCRENDQETIDILNKLNQKEVSDIVKIERGILSQFSGGCHIPIGVFAEKVDGHYRVRVNFESKWEHFPNRVALWADDPEEAIVKFESLKEPRYPKKILITKTLERDSFLKRAGIYKGFSIVEMPFIETQSVAFEFNDVADWIFFSSANAVQHFFETVNPSTLSHRKFGCLGEATARKLAKYVDHIDFFGTGNAAETAYNFKELLRDQLALFPISDISLKSVQKHLEDKSSIDLVVYKTQHKSDISVPEIDGIIFSSPSNVDACFSIANIKLPSLVIAMGPSTSKSLEQRGIKHLTAKVPHEAEIFNLVAG